MAELRWNPLLNTWTIAAPNRQARPDLPTRGCPFCPGSGKVPDKYEVFAYDNDFPALTLDAEAPAIQPPFPYRSEAAYGKCEVILYSDHHEAAFSTLSTQHIEKIVMLWQERFAELTANEKIKHVFIFENKGEEVGVTMTHPHGQIYAYGFLPLKIETELRNCLAFYERENECLICAITGAERSDEKRVVYENPHFISYIPHFTDYPFGAFIAPKRHILNINQMSDAERRGFADALKQVTRGFDKVFNRPFPYMLCIHQSQKTVPGLPDCAPYYHLHVEFYTPLRGPEQIKWNASSETGAWAAANPLSVEETAPLLRDAINEISR